MEGVPQNDEESVVSFEKYQKLKEEGARAAEALIAEIEGFEGMSADEQVGALSELHEKLAEDNDNRFIAKCISLEIERIKEVDRHEQRMEELAA